MNKWDRKINKINTFEIVALNEKGKGKVRRRFSVYYYLYFEISKKKINTFFPFKETFYIMDNYIILKSIYRIKWSIHLDVKIHSLVNILKSLKTIKNWVKNSQKHR